MPTVFFISKYRYMFYQLKALNSNLLAGYIRNAQSRSAHDDRLMLCDSSPAYGQEAVLDGISLCFSEAAALGQPVHGVEQRVDQGGVRLRAGKQRCTLGQQWQHGRAQIPVEGQRHVCCTEYSLRVREGERDRHKERKSHSLNCQLPCLCVLFFL